jgi:ribonuclease VapC
MILDTSVLIAIIQRQTGWERHQQALEEAPLLRISAGTLQEILVVAHGRALLAPVEALLALLDPDVVPVDAASPVAPSPSTSASAGASISASARASAMPPS